MLKCERIDISEGINLSKTNKSVKCDICHYWNFKDIGFKFQPYVCNACHDFLMTVYELKNFMILKIKGIDYRCYVFNVSKRETRNLLNNFLLDDKGVLLWILVQIKQLLK